MLLPGLKKAFHLDLWFNIFENLGQLVQKSIDEHKKTFDEENIRDFTDLYLAEIQNIKDQNSSMLG